MRRRVQKRGDIHQTLRADAPTKSHEEVIWMFIKSTEAFSLSEVDDVLGMEIGEPMEDSVRRPVEGVIGVLGLEIPSDEKIEGALDLVKEYASAIKTPREKKSINYWRRRGEVL